ncbi:MAG: ATP-binding protein [Candidatus Wallbacteria bacterium]|nr:ATP-binding protein [Candidatus Wallbacteria bacterium]
MDEELVRILKHLRLPTLLARWDEYLQVAQQGRFSPVRLLQHVLVEEARAKGERACTQRLQRARIPELLVMETFPFARQPKLDKKRVLSLYDAFDFIEKRQNLIWLGPTGCGKTGLATSFLVQAIRRGHTGRSVLFPELVAELYASVGDHSEEKVLKRYLAYECLLVDEVGYVEIEPLQVGLFFTLMQRRHKKGATLITSNLGFSDWRTFLKNDHLTVALIDRLTETSHVINMKNCVSLRPRLGQEP